MWFKKKEEKTDEQVRENERKLFRAILDSLNVIEKRMASLEIEVDSLKVRWKKKLIEPEEQKETKDINSGVILPM